MAGTIAQSIQSHKSRGSVRINVTIVTDASGDATATNIGTPVYGRLVGVMTDGGLDGNSVITLLCDGYPIAGFLASAHDFDSIQKSHRLVGLPSTTAGQVITPSDTAVNVYRDIVVAGQLSIGVSAGGNAQTGKYAFIIDEEFAGGMSADL